MAAVPPSGLTGLADSLRRSGVAELGAATGIASALGLAGTRQVGQTLGGGVASIIGSALGTVGGPIGGLFGSLLGGLVGLVTGDLSPRKPPKDILVPLRALQTEIAAGRPNSAVARAAEREFELRTRGLLADNIGRVPAQRATGRFPGITSPTRTRAAAEERLAALRDVSATGGRFTTRTARAQIPVIERELLTGMFAGELTGDFPVRELEAIKSTREVFQGLSARQVLAALDVLPGLGTFGFLPQGTLVDSARELEALQSTPPVDVGPTLSQEEIRDTLVAISSRSLARGRSNVSGIGQTRIRSGEQLRQLETGLFAGVLDPLPQEVQTLPLRERERRVRERRAQNNVGLSGRDFLRLNRSRRTGEQEAMPSLTGTDNGIIGGALTGLGNLVGSLSQSPLVGQIVASQFPTRGAQQIPAGQPFDPRFLVGAQASSGGMQSALGLDLPFIDVAPQGAAGAFLPFRTSATGTQVAKPFMAVRDNGKMEWFIPAGQPTGWTKASRKKRKCPARCMPTRRRRRPR